MRNIKKKTKLWVWVLIGIVVFINIGLGVLNYFLMWSWINFLWLWLVIVLAVIVVSIVYVYQNRKGKGKGKVEIPIAIPADKAIEKYVLGETGLEFDPSFANKILEYQKEVRVVGTQDSEKEEVMVVRIPRTYYPPYHIVWYFLMNLNFKDRRSLVWVNEGEEDSTKWSKKLERSVNGLASNPPLLEVEEEEVPDINPITRQPTGMVKIKRKRYTRKEKDEAEKEEEKEIKESLG